MTQDRRVIAHQELGGMRPGTWRAVIDAAGTAKERRTAALCCPDCGCVGFLDAEHVITADGLVEPSVACFTPGCTFHERVRLDGWNA